MAFRWPEGCARGGRRRPRGGSRRAPLAAVPGPETAAPAKVTQRPALTHSQERSQGPARKSAPRAGPRGLSFPGAEPGPAGAWSGRAGDGPGPVTCGRRRRASLLCPAGWSSSRPRSRSPSRASGRRAATRLRPSPRRAEPGAGPPRGEARGDTAAGRGSQPPRRRTARWRRPPPRPRSSARPGSQAPGVSSTESGSARVSRLWG